ncbi:MAG: tape measure protein [Dokdonella sp.]|uniref:tape measure protein n=1 Tax=Dokdonella sp. TaxID=2291710 RepID=UPI0025C1B686|nr:tape measure protein [Dokdonella sp.]MBK8123920.1 tape measure protein [Dokdonella sp.]
MATRSLLAELVLRVRDEGAVVIERTRAGLAGIGNAASAALEPLQSFWALIGAAVSVGGAKELTDRADAYTNLSNQVKVATNDEADYQASMQSVADVAKDANANLDSTARLYGKVKQNADSLGISQQQVADVTSVVAKGMQLSGAEAGAAAGATLQFTQALGSGVLRGEEFNSILEASPALIKAIADGLGVTVGEMRGLAEAGQLTSDRVVQALLSQKAAIDETYAKLPQTVAQATQQLDNAATLFVGRLNEQLGATHSLTDGLKFLANNMDAVAALMGAAFATAAAKAVQSTWQFVTASIAARDAARQQAIAAEQQQAANIAAAQSHVAAAQAAYNRALAEQRATQAQLASLEALAGLFASEEALAIARGQATAAANAAAAATQRYAAAQAALNAAQGPAAASVGLFSRALAFLAGPGGLVLAAISAFGLLFSLFSDNKQTVDDLTGSTDRYADALKRMNAAQASAALLKVNDALADQRRVVSDLQGEVDRLNGIMAYYQQTGTKTDLTVRALTEANGKLADANGKLQGLEEKRADILKRVNEAQQEAANADLKQVTAYNQLITALDKVGGILQAREKYLKQVSDAEIAETQALIDKAKALGDTNEVERLTIEIAQQSAKAAQQAAGLAQAEANAEEAKIATLEKLRDVQDQLTPGQQKSLALAQEGAVAKHAEAEAAQALADKLANEAHSVELLTTSEKARVEQIGQVVDGYTRLQSASAAYYDALIEQAQAEGRERDARALTIEKLREQARMQELIAEQKRLEAAAAIDVLNVIDAEIARRKAANEEVGKDLELKRQQQQIAVQIAAIEAGAATAKTETAKATAELTAKTQAFVAAGYDEIEAKKLALLASGQYTAALKLEEEQRKKVADAAEKQKDADTGAADALRAAVAAAEQAADAAKVAADQTQAASNFASSALQGWSDRLGALSDKARQAFDGYDGSAQKAADSSQELADAIAGLATGGYVEWANKVAIRALEIEQRFNGQKEAAQRLTEQLQAMADDGRVNMAAMAEATRGVSGEFDLLDQQRLDNLQSAIDAANAKLQQMQQEAEDTRANIARLNAEIAAEQGDTEKAALLKQQLDYQQALADIEAKRSQAELEGNRELVALYEEQARKLTELNALKEKNIKADAESARQQSASNTTSTAALPGGAGAAALPSSSGTSARTYNLNLTGVNGRTLPATTTTDPTSFLDELERAQRSAA